jgi:hypothetical protein
MVSLKTLEMQSVLDPQDKSLAFTCQEKAKPIILYRLKDEFLLVYSIFAFFIDRRGRMTRPELMITWEGKPSVFGLSYPYILAFEPDFIEIRNVESGQLVDIITGKNIRMLHESTDEVSFISVVVRCRKLNPLKIQIFYACEDDVTGDEVIVSLDFSSIT